MRNPPLFSTTHVQEYICKLLSNSEHCSGNARQLDNETWCGSELLWKVACENEIETMVTHCLSESLGAKSLPPQWLHVHDCMYDIMLQRLATLDSLADSLATEGIKLVALKNAGIARGIHSCVGCCPMSDIDVLVDFDDFERAHHIVLDNGFQFSYRNSEERLQLAYAFAHGSAEYCKQVSEDNTLWLELQWRPVAGRWIARNQEPSSSWLLQRSISIEGSSVHLLAPEDNLLQVSLHTAKHSYVRAPGFRLHLDVDRIVRAYPSLSWDEFLMQVESLRVKTAVYFSLLIPYSLLNTPIPTRVLERLRPPRWKESWIVNWLNKVGLFWSPGSKFNLASYYLFSSLLYDDPKDVVRLAVPNKSTIRSTYHNQHSKPLWSLYAQHWADLFFRRRTI